MIFSRWWRKKFHRIFQYTPIKEDWLFRSPYFFFATLSSLLEKRKDWTQKIKFHYIGEIPEWLPIMVDKFNLTKNVVLHGYQNQQNVLQLEKSFDILLSTSEKVIGDEHFCLPSKLFTYLKSSKPLLGFVTNGIQKEFLIKCGIGTICDPDNIDKSVEILENFLINGFKGQLNESYLKNFSDEFAIEKLVTIVKESVS